MNLLVLVYYISINFSKPNLLPLKVKNYLFKNYFRRIFFYLVIEPCATKIQVKTYLILKLSTSKPSAEHQSSNHIHADKDNTYLNMLHHSIRLPFFVIPLTATIGTWRGAHYPFA